MPNTTINIDVVGGAIVCDAKGGNVRGHVGDRVTWHSAHYNFSLRFALLTGEGKQNWPFQGPPAPPSEVKDFPGVLALADPNDPPAYKYTVIIDGYLPLDPIIIVDR